MFRPDAQIHTADLKAFARKLAAVELKDRASEAELPSSITFLQGYHARRVEDLERIFPLGAERTTPYPGSTDRYDGGQEAVLLKCAGW